MYYLQDIFIFFLNHMIQEISKK